MCDSRNLLDPKERIAQQLLTNRPWNRDLDAFIHAPLQLLCDMWVVGLDMVCKLEVGLCVFVSAIDFGLYWKGGEDVEETVVHVGCGSLKEASAST